jgi:hypothetical protein
MKAVCLKGHSLYTKRCVVVLTVPVFFPITLEVEAFQSLMSGPGGPMGLLSNPQKLQEMMADPEVGPTLQKIMSKMMGGLGGMPGGAAAGRDRANDDNDDMPDLEDLPNLD